MFVRKECGLLGTLAALLNVLLTVGVVTIILVFCGGSTSKNCVFMSTVYV